MEIIPGVHVIPSSIVNTYLIVEPDGLTLIDTGLFNNGKKIAHYINSLGRTLSDLRRIVITHSDGDHVGSLAELKQASGALVYASGPEAQAIESGRASRRLKGRGLTALVLKVTERLFKFKPAHVDEVISDGQVLPVFDLHVVGTPGHTPGHISLFAPGSGLLFVGDSLIADENGLHGSTGGNTWDQAQADESVRKQAALQPKIVCPGHGPVVREPRFPV